MLVHSLNSQVNIPPHFPSQNLLRLDCHSHRIRYRSIQGDWSASTDRDPTIRQLNSRYACEQTYSP